MIRRSDFDRRASVLPGRGLVARGFAICLLMLAIPQLAWAQSWSASKAAQIDRIIAHFRELNAADDATPPSMSLSVGIDGLLVSAKGYGASAGKPVDGRTLYDIGSITKQFTAAVVLEMIKKGAVVAGSRTPLALSTPLSSIFDHPLWKRLSWLTIGRLLTMQSNLPNFTQWPPVGTDPWGSVDAEALLRDIETEPPVPMSDDFDYSNTNYFLLAEILERSVLPGGTAPETYHDLLRKWIFEPAGMTETGFIDEARTSPDIHAPAFSAMPTAAALKDQAAAWARPDYGRRQRPPFIHPDWLKGSADAVSSARDLFAWNKALMDPKIVPQDIREAMLSGRARVSPSMYYGMGWFYQEKDDQKVYSHSGSVPGYTSYNEIVRQKGGGWFSISILSNGDQLDGLDDLARDIAYVVVQ